MMLSCLFKYLIAGLFKFKFVFIFLQDVLLHFAVFQGLHLDHSLLLRLLLVQQLTRRWMRPLIAIIKAASLLEGAIALLVLKAVVLLSISRSRRPELVVQLVRPVEHSSSAHLVLR